MGTYLRCAICGLKIPVDPYCMCPLGEHFVQQHPDAGVNFYTNDKEIKEITRKEREVQKTGNLRQQLTEKFKQFGCREKLRKASEKVCLPRLEHLCRTVRNFDNKSCSRSNCPEFNNRSSNGLNKGAHAFRTTVESWNSSTLKVKCPKCNVTDRPCIRKQKNKIATSSVGAFCMNTCWPICFMPFLMPQSSTLDLYCKHCGFFMGEYNRATGKLLCRCKSEGKKLTRVPCKVE
ncbi:unnamed protein product [Callosobruchus maculatus]|uniref:LITAF domain-containing protein n=1 Tax=Callosobruchus maculatus TaxID=64391 RepID=A0A653BPK4_CALMS|nr:unnamed protein product [Callosobruchus maculatus]